ncbi:MAG: tetratricopeptide repeat protein [Bryobacteraceae bacterium]
MSTCAGIRREKLRFAAALVLCVAALLFETGCSRADKPQVERIAILPFENLTPQDSLHWVGPAVAGILTRQVFGASDTHASETRSLTDAWGAPADRAIQGYYSIYRGQLRVTATLQDLERSQTLRTVTAAGNISGDLLTLADSLVRQLGFDPQPYPTASEEAIRALYQAAVDDPKESARHFEAALEADPQFAPAYLAYAQTLVARGDREEAQQVLERAAAHAKNFAPLDLGRLELLRTNLEGDQDQISRALAQMARISPNDVSVWNRLAALRLERKNFQGAAEAYRSALRIEPASIEFWNAQAYAYAYDGKFEDAVKSLEKYRELAPDDANALDSLGEVHFAFGRFDQAQRFFEQAHEKNSGLLAGGHLFRAGFCAYMRGDLKQADEFFNRYAEFRESARDLLVPVREALWLHMTGRSKQAVSELEKFIAGPEVPGDAAAVARSQLALWALESGDASRARELARKGLASGSSPAARSLAEVVTFLSSRAASAADWKSRAERVISTPGQETLGRQLLGYALLLNRHFREAVPVWQQIYAAAGPHSNGDTRTVLSWALVESGTFQEASALLDRFPLPPRHPEPGFSTLTWPRFFDLKARILEKTGQPDRARTFRELYQQYSPQS